MNVFTCERCGYNTHVKCNLISHFRRKIPCNPDHSSKKCEVLLSKLLQQSKLNDDRAFVCELCSKSFTSRQGKYQHKKFCKGFQTPPKFTVEEKPPPIAASCRVSRKQVEVESLEHENLPETIIMNCTTASTSNTNNTVDELKSKVDQLMQEIEELKKTRNVTHNTTVINIQQNTFILNSYNHVSTDFIHSDIMIKLLSKTYFQQLFDSLKEVVHLIYYNDRHPENHTVYIPNVRGKFAKVWNGRLWIIKNRDEILTNVRNRSIELMNDFFYDNEQKFNLIQKQHLQKWHDRYFNDSDKNFDKQTKSIVEETILSYQSIVKKTIDNYNLL